MARKRKTPTIPGPQYQSGYRTVPRMTSSGPTVPILRDRRDPAQRMLPGYDYGAEITVADHPREVPGYDGCEMIEFANTYLRGEPPIRRPYPSTFKTPEWMLFRLESSPSDPECNRYLKDLWRRHELLKRAQRVHFPTELGIPVMALDRLTYFGQHPRFCRPFAGGFHSAVKMNYLEYRKWCAEHYRPRYTKGAKLPPERGPDYDGPRKAPDISPSPEDREAFEWSKKIYETKRFKIAPAIRSSVKAEMEKNEQSGSPIFMLLSTTLVRDTLLEFIPRLRDMGNMAGSCQKAHELIYGSSESSVTIWDLRTHSFNHCEKDRDVCDALLMRDPNAIHDRGVRPILLVQNSHKHLSRKRDSIPKNESNIEGATFDPFGKMMTALHFFRNQIKVLHLNGVPLLTADSVGIIVRSLPNLKHLTIADCELVNFCEASKVLDVISEARRSLTNQVVDEVIPVDKPVEPPAKTSYEPIHLDLDISPVYWVGEGDATRVGSYGIFYAAPSRAAMPRQIFVLSVIGKYLEIVTKGFEMGVNFTEKGCAMRRFIERLPLDYGLGIHIIDAACRHYSILKHGMKGLTNSEKKDVQFRQDCHINYLYTEFHCDELQFQTLLMNDTSEDVPYNRPTRVCSTCRRGGLPRPLVTWDGYYQHCYGCKLADLIEDDEKVHHWLAKKRQVAKDIVKRIKWSGENERFMTAKEASSNHSFEWRLLLQHEEDKVLDLAELAQNYKLYSLEAQAYQKQLRTIKERDARRQIDWNRKALKHLESSGLPRDVWASYGHSDNGNANDYDADADGETTS
ncbi:hypothetical protein MKZ38_007869 [Zalerion maritima]|uniref:Uncharacterized protein n=1 Tax=Zalerion maritima TaxID=339359 RepID=A0AAD5RWF7_9PEZI|nr:hypothetical protein MKZ38_007869 [Zalerion maritima]